MSCIFILSYNHWKQVFKALFWTNLACDTDLCVTLGDIWLVTLLCAWYNTSRTIPVLCPLLCWERGSVPLHSAGPAPTGDTCRTEICLPLCFQDGQRSLSWLLPPRYQSLPALPVSKRHVQITVSHCREPRWWCQLGGLVLLVPRRLRGMASTTMDPLSGLLMSSSRRSLLWQAVCGH